MKKFFAICLALTTLVACNKKNAQMLGNVNAVNVECNPEVLESIGGKIPVAVEVTYPEGFITKDGMMVVTPVLVFGDEEYTCQPYTYQGEDVKENHKVVSSKGGTIRESFTIPFVKGMEKSHLEMRSVVFAANKRLDLPAIKVADGVRTVYNMAKINGYYDYKKDNYQEKYIETAEGQIHYNVNSSEVGNQMSGKSMKEYQNELKEREKEGMDAKGTKIISYASPEGGEEYNAKLSDKRSASAEKAWDKISKGGKADEVEVQSVGQDWEGFKEAVSNSNIEDKELILRVLSMYSDPAVRESEIKNMSELYSEIKQQVFPELRRSRFVTEYEIQNYSDEDLQKLYDRKLLYLVDEEGIMRIAANCDSLSDKRILYNALADKYDSDRARYNLGVTYLESGSSTLAQNAFDKMKDQKDADLINAEGVLAMRAGKYDDADALFFKSGTDDAKKNLGVLALVQGDYAEAAKRLKGLGGESEAVANIMNGDYSSAISALDGYDSAEDDYIRAIAAARQGKASDVKTYLNSAFSKDSSLKEKAANDIEFTGFEF